MLLYLKVLFRSMLNNKRQEGEDMVQVLTVKIKILPTKKIENILEEMGKEYISVVNDLVHAMVNEKKVTKKTSKHVQANIPSALKSQAIRDASSIFLKKVKKVIIRSFRFLRGQYVFGTTRTLQSIRLIFMYQFL